MDEDDHMIGYDVQEDEPTETAISNANKSKKTVASENKSKPKSKKSNAKSWSTSATGASGNSGVGSHADTSAFSFHRMRTLMKTQASIQNITHDATFLVAKATELFIRDVAYRMAEEALASDVGNVGQGNGLVGDSSLVVNYDHLAEIVHSNKRLEFLREFVPHKVLAAQIIPEIGSTHTKKTQIDGEVIDLGSESS